MRIERIIIKNYRQYVKIDLEFPKKDHDINIIVGKNGVVRDKSTHISVIENVINCANELGLFTHNLQFSPIKGPKGNIEYLIHLKNTPTTNKINVEEIVNFAMAELE